MGEFGNNLEEMNIDSFMAMRDWMEKAITDAGGVITDAGIGAGRADIGFTYQGMPFGVQIVPRSLSDCDIVQAP